MDFNEYQAKLDEQIKNAENTVAEDTDRIPIVSDIPVKPEAVHGYVKPGEKPVACTSALKPSIESIVSDDGTITGELPAGSDAEHAHHTVSLSPDDDNYLYLLNDILSGYKVKHDVLH